MKDTARAGVHLDPGAVLGARSLRSIEGDMIARRAVALRASADPTAGMQSGSFGLPGDFLIGSEALVVGLGNHAYRHALGTSWYVLLLYVPLVCLSQAMLLVRLLQKQSTSATNAGGFVHEGSP